MVEAADRGPAGGRFGRPPLSLGRTFILWLLGVLLLVLVTVSALVLWHEQQVLESELVAQGDLLAHLLALSAADGGSSEYLAALSLTDLVAGEVRSADGQILWRYGPPVAEARAIGWSLLEVEARIEIATGPWGRDRPVEVTVLLSRARVQANLAGAAVRLLVALGIALAIAMSVGLWLVGRLVQPLNELAELSRSFDSGAPMEVGTEGPWAAELVELATAFREMTARLSEQRHNLEASERRYRELFASSPTPLLELDDELAVRGANPAAAAFLGGDAAVVLGRPLNQFLADRPGRGVDRAPAAGAGGGEGVVETRWRMPDGDLAEVELHLRPAGDGEGRGTICAVHDLTDRVRRLGERWRHTFDAMIDGVALVGRDGAVEAVNRALAPHLPALARELTERAGREGSWRTGSLDRLLECDLSRPVGLDHAVLVVRDVTEAVTAEARLREAEKMQAVATLASGVAHDFNNLLAAILLHARWLEGEPERAAEAAAAIRELAEQGGEVVGELLLFARSDEGLPPRTFDLAELVRGQEGVLRHLLPANVTLHLELADGALPVTGNPVALRRLLLNLVVNARDAVAGPGGAITISLARRAGRAVLEVADTGPGIAAEHRERLFEPFFTLSRKGRGAGLGLAVVYAIATAHGGDVEIVSGPGEGACFSVRLPPGDPAKLEPLDDPGSRFERERARVLVVEADGRAASQLIEIVAGAGYDVRHAPDAAVADRLLTDWSPGAVLVRADRSAARSWAAGTGLPVVVTDGQPTGSAEVLLERLAAAVPGGRPA